MINHKATIFAIFLIQNHFIFSQLKINLHAGLSFSNSRIIQETKHLQSSQLWGNPSAGVCLEKNIKDNKTINLSYFYSTVGLASKNIDPKFNYLIGHSRIGSGMHNIGLQYNKVIFDNYFFRIKSGNPLSQMRIINKTGERNTVYLFHVKLIPSIGFNLNRIKNTNWHSGYEDFEVPEDTVQNGTSMTVNFENEWNGNIQQKKYGSSLQVGFRLQFHKKEKETWAINIFYCQGLINLLSADYSKVFLKGSKDEFIETAHYKTRGSFLGVYLCYPITLINKKEPL